MYLTLHTFHNYKCSICLPLHYPTPILPEIKDKSKSETKAKVKLSQFGCNHDAINPESECKLQMGIINTHCQKHGSCLKMYELLNMNNDS